MKKNLLRPTKIILVALRIFLVPIFLISLSSQSFAQKGRIQPKEYNGDAAKNIIANASYIQERPGSSYPAFVRLETPSGISFQEFIPWLKKQVQADAEIDFKLVKQNNDDLGFQHFRYVETFRGIPIDKTWYIVHVRNNTVTSFNGLALNVTQKPSTKAALSEADGLVMAKRFVNAAKYKWEDANFTQDLRRRTRNPNASYFKLQI